MKILLENLRVNAHNHDQTIILSPHVHACIIQPRIKFENDKYEIDEA